MKLLRSILCMSLLFVLFSTGCDVVDDPLKNPEVGNPIDTSTTDPTDTSTTDPIDTSTTVKKVVLEEFTGVRCNNCPNAGKQAKALKNIYGQQLILIAIHATSLAEPNSDHPVDFTTDEGDDLAEFFGLPGVPVGFVDRVGYNGSGGVLMTSDSWGNEVQNRVQNDPVASIELRESGSNGSGNLSVNAEIVALENLDKRELWVNVVLTEDGIVAPQTMQDKSIDDDFVHNHVYRGSFNGAYGELLADNSFSAGDTLNPDFSIQFQSQWRKDRCHVIAYIYDKENYEILQAQKLKL